MKKFLFIALILAIAGGGVGYYLWNRAPAGVAHKRPDFTVTSAELLAEFQSNEESANTKYLGKVVQVNGTILEIVPGEQLQMQVVLETGDLMSRVSCSLEEDRNTFLARKLQKGSAVQIKGECTGILDDIILERCVIVNE